MLYNVNIAPDKYDAAILPTFNLLEELADWFRLSAQNGNPGCSVRLREAGFAERCLKTLQLLHDFSDAAIVEPRVRAAAEMAADHVGPTPLEVLSASLPPIAGGAPVGSSEEDEGWRDYGLWLDSLDAQGREFHGRLMDAAEREPVERDWDAYAEANGLLTSDGLPPLW